MNLPHFFADTWWYAMTNRVSDQAFLDMVTLREAQGFTAAQVVVGIPPEVGPYNKNAEGAGGAAWDLTRKINPDYLPAVRERIKIMNEHHLTAIVYGAWGPQIDWVGDAFMAAWWEKIVRAVDDLDVFYSLTGEVDLFVDPIHALALLPDHSCKEPIYIDRETEHFEELKRARYQKWETVLAHLSTLTERPIIVHPWVEDKGKSGYPNFMNRDLLAANTFQTGHDRGSMPKLWKTVYNSKREYPNLPAINLEPWYEGIKGNFYGWDQLLAFWLAAAAGAHSLCYGAQGLWSASDGDFLSQWGDQSMNEALALKTPEVLGKCYKILAEEGVLDWEQSEAETSGDTLLSLTRVSADGKKLMFIPEMKNAPSLPALARFLLPQSGEWVTVPPTEGPLAVFYEK